MKHFFFSFLMVSCATTLTAQCYQLVWSDEFTGANLDVNKWTPIVGEGGAVSGNAELQYYTARSQNIEVSNGTLKLIALSENYGGNAYTSARMQTKNLADFLYGKFEARIKLPIGKGMWPAFWMLPTDNVYGIWPRSGEMDIMELIGIEPTHAFGTIHTSNDGTVRTYSSQYNLPSGTFADDYHIFSMEWSPNLIQFYVDGNLYATKTNTTVSPYPWVFDKRFYLLLNLAMGGSWAGPPDGTTTFPQIMTVDYVRVYQKTNDMAITGAILVEPSTPSVVYTVPNISGMTYQWAVTGSGNAIASGQGTAAARINWGTTSGTVSVVLNDGCAASTTVFAPVTVSANLWDNYGFEQNYVSWDTRPAYSSAVLFTISNTDFTEGAKAACAQINTASTDPWNIQLSRTNLNLTAGTSYTLSFKAKADVNRTIPISFIRPVVFSTVAGRTINLTTNWQTFSMAFTPSSNENVMFNADLAAQTGTICFDNFVFARTAVLPVDLMDFKGVAEQKGNRLTWTVAAEKSLKSFDIERQNAQNVFESIGTITAQNTAIAYTFTDEKPHAEVLYYRLKITELDGKIHYSKIIALKRGNTEGVFSKLKIYPNPANEVLNIENADGKTVEIVNVLGQIVLTVPISNAYTLSINDLKSGIYFVKTAGEVVRFVKH